MSTDTRTFQSEEACQKHVETNPRMYPDGAIIEKLPGSKGWWRVKPKAKTAEQLFAEMTAKPPGKAAAAPAAEPDPFVSKPKPRRKAITRGYDTFNEEPLVTIYPSLLWAGKHTTIGGDPGLGKSIISVDIAARLSRGGKVSPYSDEEFEPRVVIIGSAEDGAADTIKARLRVAGADMKNVHDLVGILSPDGIHEHLNLGEHLRPLDEMLGDLKPGLLVLDPISSFLGKIDSHQGSQVRGVVDPLKQMLERHLTALLSIQHLNKNSKVSAIYRLTGSVSLVGAPRAAFMFLEDKTKGSPDDRLLLPIKVNLKRREPGYGLRINTKDGQPLMEWLIERVDQDVNEVLGALPPTKTKLAEDMLRDALTSGEVSAADIERMCRERDFGRQTRRDALKAIGAQAKRVGVKGSRDGQWVWFLPPGLIQSDEGFDDAPIAETLVAKASESQSAAERNWLDTSTDRSSNS